MSAREAARVAARAAHHAWVRAVLADAADLADAAGVHGPDRVLVMHADVVPAIAGDDDFLEWRAELVSLTVAADAQPTQITADSAEPLWVEAVSLWGAMRDVLTAAYNYPMSPGLVVDLDRGIVGVWEPLFCPDEGPLPSAIAELLTDIDADDDPFAALLRDDEQDLDECEDRLIDLMIAYELAPPSSPAHEPGDCGDEALEG